MDTDFVKLKEAARIAIDAFILNDALGYESGLSRSDLPPIVLITSGGTRGRGFVVNFINDVEILSFFAF
jgi:hypothetical protein